MCFCCVCLYTVTELNELLTHLHASSGDILARIPVELAFVIDYTHYHSGEVCEEGGMGAREGDRTKVRKEGGRTERQRDRGGREGERDRDRGRGRDTCSAVVSIRVGMYAVAIVKHSCCVCMCLLCLQGAGARLVLDMADEQGFWRPMFK